jgi:hypothetical protein
MATGRKSRSKKPNSNWTWTLDQEEAFQTLKDTLIPPPILGYSDFSKPFELHTDACGTGFGAVLYQKLEGANRVIAYASRGPSRLEKNYPTHKLEFLALKWAVTQKFSDYPISQTFSVLTDNNLLTYILTSAKLDATGHRWVAALSAYQFIITYKPGKMNADADGLCRLPETLDVDSVKSICDLDQGRPLIDTLPVQSLQQLQMDYHPISRVDLHELQHKDPVLSNWFEYIQEGKKTKVDSLRTEFEKSLCKNFKKLGKSDGLLVREIASNDGSTKQQILITRYVVPLIKALLHNKMGHPGRDQTTSLVTDRFYWPKMRSDIQTWVEECNRFHEFQDSYKLESRTSEYTDNVSS